MNFLISPVCSLADVVHVDTAAAVQGMGGHQTGDQPFGVDNFDVDLDPVLRLQRAAVCLEPNGSGHFVRRERVPDVAGENPVDVPVDDNAVVPVGAAEHNAIRALDEETGLSVALWRLQFGVVHLFADFRARR